MTRGKQVLLALLSLVLLVVLGFGIVWGQRFLLRSSPKDSHTTFKPAQTENRESVAIEAADKAVALLEDKPSSETLKAAQDAVAKLTKGKTKDSLLARVSLMQAKIKNKAILEEAERSVAYLEQNPELSNISLAQDLVTKVTEPTAKKALLERIRVVQEGIGQREKAHVTSQTTSVSVGAGSYEVSEEVLEPNHEETVESEHPAMPEGDSVLPPSVPDTDNLLSVTPEE